MLYTETLFRLQSRTAQDIIPLDFQVHNIALSVRRIQAITTVREKDPILPTMYHLTVNVWPFRCSDIPKIAWWDMHNELSMEDGLLIKGERTVIPTALCDQFLADLHGRHTGICKSQQQAKQPSTDLALM